MSQRSASATALTSHSHAASHQGGGRPRRPPRRPDNAAPRGSRPRPVCPVGALSGPFLTSAARLGVREGAEASRVADGAGTRRVTLLRGLQQTSRSGLQGVRQRGERPFGRSILWLVVARSAQNPQEEPGSEPHFKSAPAPRGKRSRAAQSSSAPSAARRDDRGRARVRLSASAAEQPRPRTPRRRRWPAHLPRRGPAHLPRRRGRPPGEAAPPCL